LEEINEKKQEQIYSSEGSYDEELAQAIKASEAEQQKPSDEQHDNQMSFNKALIEEPKVFNPSVSLMMPRTSLAPAA
jgi:hypothetical protein